MLVKDKVCLVTGGAKGIGKGISKCLLEEGANVVIADIDLEGLNKTKKEFHNYGDAVSIIKADVSVENDVKKMMEKIVSHYGKIDVLVNNAAITRCYSSFFNMDSKEWDRVLGVNLKGAFLCCNIAGKFMSADKNGVIINIGSVDSLTPEIGVAHYCAAKSGIEGLTRALAVELADFNIRVNAVLPGAIVVEGNESYYLTAEAQEFVKRIPLKRRGKPEEIGHLVTFLASERAAYITGQCLVVDGGITIGACVR